MAYSDEELDAAWNQYSGTSGVSDVDLDAIWNSYNPPTFRSEASAVAKQGVRGLANLAGSIYDISPIGIPVNAYNRYQEMKEPGGKRSILEAAFPNKYGPKLIDIVNRYIGTETPQTAGGRIAGTAAKDYLPMALLPGSKVKLATSAASMAGAGLAGGAARELTANPWAELAASVVGASPVAIAQGVRTAGKNVVSALSPLWNPAAQKEMAARGIKELVGEANVPGVVNAIDNPQAALNPDLGALRTTAEVTKNPQLAALEKDLVRNEPAAREAMAANDAQRQAIRNSLETGTVPEAAIVPETVERGTQLQAALAGQEEPIRNAASALYEAVDPAGLTRIPVRSVGQKIQPIVDRFLNTGVKKPTKETEQILTEFGVSPYGLFRIGSNPASENPKTWQWLQDMNVAVREQANILAAKGENQQAGILKAIQGALADAQELAAQKGAPGFTPAQQAAAQKARAAWADMAKTYDEGVVGAALKKNEFGDLKMRPEAVPGALLQNPTNVKQAIKAVGTDQQARDLLKGASVQALRRINMEKAPANWTKYVQNKAQELKLNLGSKHFKDLQAIAEDLQSKDNVTRLWSAPSKGQSITAQVSVAKWIKQRMSEQLGLMSMLVESPYSRAGAIGGGAYVGSAIGAATGVGRLLGSLAGVIGGNKLMTAFSKRLETLTANIDKQLLDAAMNPRTAKELLLTPTPDRIQKVMAPMLKTWNDAERRILLRALSDDPLQRVMGDGSPGKTEEKTPMLEALQSTQQAPAQEMAKAEASDMDRLLSAIAKVESSGNPTAVSNKGAQGMYQMMPATAKEYHKRLGMTEPLNYKDAAQQKKLATAFLSDLLNKYEDPELVLQAYNMGETQLDKRLKKYGKGEALAANLPTETRQYVPKIIKALMES